MEKAAKNEGKLRPPKLPPVTDCGQVTHFCEIRFASGVLPFFICALYENGPFPRGRFASAISKEFFSGRILFKGPFKSPRIIIELPIKLAPQTHTWEQKLTTGTSD